MEFVIGGLAATSAGFFTNPLEVIKHHLELSKKSQLNHHIHRTFLQTGLTVAKQDGLKSLQKGLSPALGAHLVSYGMKLGTYDFGQSRGFTTYQDGNVNVAKSVLTSTAGGLLGQYLSNPFYLLKAHHEYETTDKKSAGYMDTVKRIYGENGIRGFFRGATASLPRALIGTSQLTSFAVAKETLNQFKVFEEHAMLTKVIAGTVAGIVLSMAMTPFDLVLTKMYKQAIAPKPTGPKYSGCLDCLKKIYAKKGLRPFYTGMGPLYVKLGPHTVLCLVFWEEFKGIYKNQGETITSREYHPVPTNSFYEKIGFLSADTHIDHFNENFDDDSKLSVYWK